jgi:HEAT repeat protein
VRQLLSLGEARRDEARDYAALGVSPKDVPGLIRMATDQVLHNGPQDSPVVWAPVHAWRALAQLRAPEAIAPLVELFSRADDGDDWVSDDLPKMLAQFGGAALNP